MFIPSQFYDVPLKENFLLLKKRSKSGPKVSIRSTLVEAFYKPFLVFKNYHYEKQRVICKE